MAFSELRAISVLAQGMPRHRDASPEEVADWRAECDAVRQRIQARRQQVEGVA